MLINDYIQGLEAIWNQMCRIGMNVEDSNLANTLIMCLNSKFSSIASSLTSQGLEPEVAEVRDILWDEEARLGMSGQGEPPQAFIAKRRWTRGRPVCWNCNK